MSRAEKYIFYLFLFLIPLQTRKFLYSAGAVEGFNEWQSVFLYGTDLLILMLFGFWFMRWLKLRGNYSISVPRSDFSSENPPLRSQRKIPSGTKLLRFRELLKLNIPASRPGFRLLITYYLLLVTVLLTASFSIFSAPYAMVGVYRFFKLLMFIGLFFYVATALKEKIVSFSGIALAFVVGGIFQSFIAIGQFITQRSLGLRILGESYLAPGMQEVAEVIAFGGRFVRAYGTLPSPNVLAAFLAVSLLLLFSWFISRQEIKRGDTLFAGLSSVVLASALFLTFSRAVIFSFVIAFLVYFAVIFFKKDFAEYRRKAIGVLLPVLILVVVGGGMFWPEIYSRIFTTFDYGDMALRERVFFNQLSYDIIDENPGGTGIGNYTLVLREVNPGIRDSLYQPVHNIFLLVTAEIGIAGGVVFALFLLSLFLALLIKAFRRPSIEAVTLFALLVFIFISGLFDHYYWTLQQGALMFWVVLGVGYYYINLFAVNKNG
ncbi:MAG: O-antigen ligase family protein [Candidatus Spechtbacterales bacterium]